MYLVYSKKDGVVGIVLWDYSSKEASFIVLSLRLRLAEFSRVSVVSRVRVRVSVKI